MLSIPTQCCLRGACAVVALAAVLSSASTSHAARKQPKRSQKAADEKAWLDAKDVCVFRYGSRKVPKTALDFDHALTKGWERSFVLPDLESTVTVDGADRYPRLSALRIDLSEAAIDEKSTAARLRPTDRRLSGTAVHASRFELVSHPLHSGRAKVDLDVRATDVRLDFGKDKEDRPLLLMTDAKDGRLSIEVSHDDLERIVLTAAREKASKFGLDVRKLKLTLASDPVDRSVQVGVKLQSFMGGLVPAGLQFRARLDIDEDLNGKLSGLTCNGDNVLGPLISGFIRPGLKKHEGTSRPLVKFPMGTMKLRDAEITTGETVKLVAAFGS